MGDADTTAALTRAPADDSFGGRPGDQEPPPQAITPVR
jgi:hypothetical protein